MSPSTLESGHLFGAVLHYTQLVLLAAYIPTQSSQSDPCDFILLFVFPSSFSSLSFRTIFFRRTPGTMKDFGFQSITFKKEESMCISPPCKTASPKPEKKNEVDEETRPSNQNYVKITLDQRGNETKKRKKKDLKKTHFTVREVGKSTTPQAGNHRVSIPDVTQTCPPGYYRSKSRRVTIGAAYRL